MVAVSYMALLLGPSTVPTHRRNLVSSYFPVKIEISRMEKTHDPTVCCLQETHVRSKDINRLGVKHCKKISHAYSNLKRARLAIVASDKIDCKL